MAKIISPVWSIIRGSIAGTTYLSGPNNTIIARQRTAPTNPSSELQSLIRSTMQEAAALWKEVMSVSDHSAWSAYADTFTIPGPLGPKKLTGQQAFIMAYTMADYFKTVTGSGGAVGVGAPVISGLLDVGSYVLAARTAAGTGFQLNAINYSTENAIIYVQSSGPWKPSKNFFKGPWGAEDTRSFAINGSTSSSFDLDTQEDDSKYFFRVRSVTAQAPLRTQSAIILSGISSTV